MNPNESTPLLGQTLRAVAMMMVPVIAFLAILSAVALYAIPSSNPSAKEERVVVPSSTENNSSETQTPNTNTASGSRPPGARALVRPNKI